MSEPPLTRKTPIQRFLYGNERPGIGAFFRTVTFRLALAYPFCVLLSNSLTDAWDLLLIAFWLLGGNWKERFQFIRNSPILICAAILLLFSSISVFQYETTFFQSLKYWRGHQPLPILIILATLLTTKTRRVQMLGSLGLALLTVLFSAAVIYQASMPEPDSCPLLPHIADNTIWFGMSFVVLLGLWLCAPYISRLNPYLRHRLSPRIRHAMRSAGAFDPANRARLSFSPPSWTTFFILFRWTVIACAVAYVFWFNPSRTAALAIILGVALLSVLRRRMRVILVAVACLCTVVLIAYGTSSTFQRKWGETSKEVHFFQEGISKGENKIVIGGRLHLYWHLSREILRHPLGIGMDKTRRKCLEYTDNRLDNIHNEFMTVGLHSGIQGLVCFLLLFFYLFRQSRNLPDPWKSLGLYTAVTLLVACSFNGALSQDMEGHLYSVLIALIASADAARKTTRPLRPESAGNLSVKQYCCQDNKI